MFRSCAASGEGCGAASVLRGERYSRKGEEIDSGRTRWFGLNFRAWGLLVGSEGWRWDWGTYIGVWRWLGLDEHGPLSDRD
jgi:hypothetical protein